MSNTISHHTIACITVDKVTWNVNYECLEAYMFDEQWYIFLTIKLRNQFGVCGNALDKPQGDLATREISDHSSVEL